jgi:Predicted membrane protein
MDRVIGNNDAHGTENSGDKTSGLSAVAAGVVTFVTLGAAFGLLALGYPFFWIAFPVGFGGGLPLAIALTRWYESDTATDNNRSRQGHNDTDTSLAELRDRYARGELDDEEFEARVERLLETESVADAKYFAEHRTTPAGGSTDHSRNETATDDAVESERA